MKTIEQKIVKRLQKLVNFTEQEAIEFVNEARNRWPASDILTELQTDFWRGKATTIIFRFFNPWKSKKGFDYWDRVRRGANRRKIYGYQGIPVR